MKTTDKMNMIKTEDGAARAAEPRSNLVLASLFKSRTAAVAPVTDYVWRPGPGAMLPAFTPDAPRSVWYYGRSKIGKSLIFEFTSEAALDAKMPLVLADFDRDNASATARFTDAGVIRPKSASDPHFTRAIQDSVMFQIAERVDINHDIGFGSGRAFRENAVKMGLQAILEREGIRPVLVIPLGTNTDDIMVIEALNDVFLPRDILLVVNEGLIDPIQDVALEFEPVLNDPRIRALIERGARLLRMPRLPGGERFHNTKEPFWRAARSDWPNPLNMFERAGANRFLTEAYERFREVADIIPFPLKPMRDRK